MRLAVSELDVRQGETTLLRAVEFSVAAGEAVACVGRSGLGKTTLLRTLAALHIDPGGAVSVEGETVAQVGVPEWRTRCLYVSQDATMFDDTVRENLARPFRFAVRERTVFDEVEAEAQLAAVGLHHVLGRQATSLSGGERQRLHIVRALLLQPKVLMLDEPVSSLDDESAAEVWASVDRFRDEGGGIVLVHHGAPPPWARPLDLKSFV